MNPMPLKERMTKTNYDMPTWFEHPADHYQGVVGSAAATRSERPRPEKFPPPHSLSLRFHSESWSKVAHKKHRGDMPQTYQGLGAMAAISDRDPLMVEETRARMTAHEQALGEDSNYFHRRAGKNSCGRFLEDGRAMRALCMGLHPDRDPQDTQPPVSGYTWPRSDSGPETGGAEYRPPWMESAPEGYDVDITILRPRTVGYSPGHVRSLGDSPDIGTLSFGTLGRRMGSPNSRRSGTDSALSPTKRFNTIGLSKEFGRSLTDRSSFRTERRAERTRTRNRRQAVETEGSETLSAISNFETRLRTFKNATRKDDDSDFSDDEDDQAAPAAGEERR